MANDVLTVLIIDDEPQIRRLVRNALHADTSILSSGAERSEGETQLRVVEAATGQEGIDLAASEPPRSVEAGFGRRLIRLGRASGPV